jgi:CRISPR-associated protein Cmr5
MTLQTNSQKMAQTAYAAVSQRLQPGNERDKYVSFSRSFPSLVHSCGLAQAIAFAMAKGHGEYLEDLAVVLKAVGHAEAETAERLERATREHAVAAYIRLTRSTLQAAGWMKRYVEAVGD